MHVDTGCGSTIGPIIATLSGILTVDVGSPQVRVVTAYIPHDIYTTRTLQYTHICT